MMVLNWGPVARLCCKTTSFAPLSRAPQILESGSIEAQRRSLEDGLEVIEIDILSSFDEPYDRAMLYLHTLWVTGRAGSVDDISEVICCCFHFEILFVSVANLIALLINQ